MMVWNKPRNVWQWLLLLAPAVLSLAVSQMQWWLSPLPILHYTNGMQVQPSLVRVTRELSVTLVVIVPGSAIIALVLSYGVSFGQRIVNTIFFFLCLLLGKGFLTGIGCAVSHAANPIEKQSGPAPIEIRDGAGGRQERN